MCVISLYNIILSFFGLHLSVNNSIFLQNDLATFNRNIFICNIREHQPTYIHASVSDN